MAVAIGLTTANKKRNNKSNTRKGEREKYERNRSICKKDYASI